MSAITPFDPPPTLEDRANFGGRSDYLFATEIPRMIGEVNDLEASLRAAATIGLPYTISTTVGGDPGAGFVRFNNATQTAATALTLDILDALGVNRSALFTWAGASTNVDKGLITITAPGDAGKLLQFAYTAFVNSTGYFTATVACVSSLPASPSSPFSNGDNVVISLDRTGNVGATGPIATWTQIGSSLTVTGSPTSITFSSIPTTYSDLLFDFDVSGFSGNTGRPAQIATSANGSSFSATVQITSDSPVGWRGQVQILSYRLDHQIAVTAIQSASATSPSASQISAPYLAGLRTLGGVSAVRFFANGDNFNNGSVVKMFGK